VQQLLGGPRSGFTEDVVLEVLSLARGAVVRHGVDVFDTTGVRQAGMVLPVEGGEVVWAFRPPDSIDDLGNEVADIRVTATLMLGPSLLEPERWRYQLYDEWLAADDETWVRFNHGMFVSTTPPADDDGQVVRRTLRLVDRSWRWKEDELDDTEVVDAGEGQVDTVRTELESLYGETSTALPASVLTLDEAMVFEAGSSRLAKWNALLQSAGCDQLVTDPDTGVPSSRLLADIAGQGVEWGYGPSLTGDRVGKILVPGSVEPLLESTPNVVRFVARQGPSLPEEGNGYKTASNQSTGPSSIDAVGEQRKRRVVVDAEDQDALEAVAAADSQRWFAGGGLRFRGQVGLNPLHGDRDVVELAKPRFAQVGIDVSGEWIVTERRYPLNRMRSADAALMSMVFEKRVEVS
jgi:hypothetical protein